MWGACGGGGVCVCVGGGAVGGWGLGGWGAGQYNVVKISSCSC